MVQAPQGRRPRLHLQLRQNHSGHVAGCAQTQHPGDLRLGRSNGGRQNRAVNGPRQARFGRFHGRCGRSQLERRGRGQDGGTSLPDLWLVLRHVHRQLHELPQRGHRPSAAGQRHHPRHARAALGAFCRGRQADRRNGQGILSRGRHVGTAAQHCELRRF